jgi:hypothetical protein
MFISILISFNFYFPFFLFLFVCYSQTEVEFYENVEKSTLNSNQELYLLRPFIPTFYGISHFDRDINKSFIEMRDLCFNIPKPCCMDLKMGTATVAQDYADEEKIKRMKYWDDIGTTKACGFRMSGMKVIDAKQNQYEIKDGNWGKNLRKETVMETFRNFIPFKHRKKLITIWKKRLNEIKEWFKTYCTKKFIGSSLLFIYDGEKYSDFPENELKNDENFETDLKSEHYVRLYMIDFAHAFPRVQNDDNGKIVFGFSCYNRLTSFQLGYLFGLENVETLLDSYLQESA